MTFRSTPVRRTALAATAAAGLVAGLLGTGLGLGSAHADTTAAPLSEASLLHIADIDRSGLTVDDARLGTRGDQYLGDAGRFDEGCLGEKTMRNITNAKAYPAAGTATAYVDAAWTSTQDKEIWVNESIAEGRTATATDRYVTNLFNEIRDVRSCEQDPAQGNHYGRAQKVTVGTATASYFVDYSSDGTTDGGGVAVVRDGNRFGFVSLMSAPGRPGVALKQLAVAAAKNLG